MFLDRASLLLRSFGCERLDLSRFHASYAVEGGPTLPPFASVKGMAVWLLPGTEQFSASGAAHPRRSGFPDLLSSGGARTDYWALNAFRKRHPVAINDCFTQVLEQAHKMGMRQLGTVAVDTTRVKASASADKIVLEKRQQRARIRRKVRSWQKASDADDNNEGAGTQLDVAGQAVDATPMPAALEPLDKPRKARNRSGRQFSAHP